METKYVIVKLDRGNLNISYVYIPYFDSHEQAWEFLLKLPKNNYYEIKTVLKHG